MSGKHVWCRCFESGVVAPHQIEKYWGKCCLAFSGGSDKNVCLNDKVWIMNSASLSERIVGRMSLCLRLRQGGRDEERWQQRGLIRMSRKTHNVNILHFHSHFLCRHRAFKKLPQGQHESVKQPSNQTWFQVKALSKWQMVTVDKEFWVSLYHNDYLAVRTTDWNQPLWHTVPVLEGNTFGKQQTRTENKLSNNSAGLLNMFCWKAWNNTSGWSALKIIGRWGTGGTGENMISITHNPVAYTLWIFAVGTQIICDMAGTWIC